MDQPPVTLRLTQNARERLNRIASDMGRTPDDLATAIVDQWTVFILANLAPPTRRPTGPNRPDFVNMGILSPSNGNEDP